MSNKPDVSFVKNQPRFVPIGFDPTTEQWKYTVVLGSESFEYSGGLWAFVPHEAQRQGLNRGTVQSYSPREHIEQYIARNPNSRLSSMARHITSGRVKISKNWHDVDVYQYVALIGKHNRPDAASFFYCMLADLDCGEHASFQDFCAELGYNNDSISALETYQGCQRSARKFRSVVTSEEIEKLRIALQDF